MTEALFMLFFVVAAFYFQKCVSSELFSSRQDNYNIRIKKPIGCFDGPKQALVSKHKSNISNNLFKCSFFVALATLCRYEAWPIPVVLALFIVLSLLRVRTIDKGKEAWGNKKRLICSLTCVVLSFSGVILWISYNWIYYDSPLEFLFSPYYSAAALAMEGKNRDSLFLQPLNAASTYGINALVFFGPVTIVGATLGYFVHKTSAPLEVQRREMLFLFLAIPSLFSFLTLVFGIGEINYWWFNSRFMIMLSPLLILLLSILIKRVTDKQLKSKSILVYVIFAILLIYPIIILPLSGEVITLIDAKNSISYGTRPSGMNIANVLGKFYESGKIFMITGSAQQNIIMQASGIPLTNFYAAIEQPKSNHQLQQLERDSHYVVLSKKPDPSSQNYANGWTERQDELRKHFDKAYENSFYILFVRN
jgi:hypothetical protein